MKVRFFGEFEVSEDGVPVPVRGAKQRALLAMLALQRGKPVSADRLIDAVWGDQTRREPSQRIAGSDRPVASDPWSVIHHHFRSRLRPRHQPRMISTRSNSNSWSPKDGA